MNCPRLNEAHPDATNPELYEARTPRECKEHFMSKMKNNRANFGEHMDGMKDAKAALDMKIKGINSLTDESRAKADKAFKEFESSMESSGESEENGCQPPSLYLPEFEEEFTDEPCPYTKEKEVMKMAKGKSKVPKEKPDIEEPSIKETSTKTTDIEGKDFSAVVTEGQLINIKHSSREGNDRLLIKKDQVSEFEKIFAMAKKAL